MKISRRNTQTLWRVASLLMVVPALAIGSAAVQAAGHEKTKYPEGKLDCRITISQTEVGFIVGVGGGSGTLDCGADGSHRFRIGGFQVGSMGLGGSTMSGKVYGLNNIRDIQGSFSRAEASIAAIAGAGTMTLENEAGVVMTVRGDKAGAKVNLGGGSLRITLE